MEIWSKFGVLVTLLICIFRCINGDTDPNDASALRTMYSSLNSPGQLDKWTANGGDPCGESWKGVTCSGSRVTEIKLSGLSLSGSMGWGLQSLTALTNLDMSSNTLAGGIPYALPPNLTQLNLANNQFTGEIPFSIASMTKLTNLNLGHNQLNQLNDGLFYKLPSLSTMDISFNQLQNNLPDSFRNLSSLTTLYLQNNQFTGTINVLADLPLKDLNIANNRFTGWVPDQLKGINLQKDGNNWSSGSAPPPPPGTPPAHRNPGHNSGGGKSPSSGSDDGGSKKSGIGGGGIAGIIISILVVAGIAAFFILKRRSKRRSPDIEKLDNEPFAPLSSNEVKEMKSVQTSSAAATKTFDTSASFNLRPPPSDRHKSFDENDSPKMPVVVVKKKPVAAPTNVTSFSIADLQIATGSFSIEHLLGEGSFGRVYRAHFDDGRVLAVKKIDSSTLPVDMSDDFVEMVSKISELHHPNVTELAGYCSEHGQHLLVYEFHRSGSLHDYLHLPDESNKPLIWNSRVKIALGTARALEYLHEVCSPSIIHKNIKSANILLDTELNPHLSDSVLASFLPNADQVLNRDAASGYGAPEVAMSGQYTLKSDVYSFGVVMLELLTGRKPFESSRPRSEQSLVRWATPQLHDIDALSKMVDSDLNGLYPIKSLSRFADVIALCVQPEPEFRPPMSEVVEALVRLVQRANMSKRTVGTDQGTSRPGDSQDNEYMS
ncbi:STRUBBELIG-receptor family 7 [Euphorbia peplus]|nr:STRUBBELIG-receptor family 7 [Euphorbia peplus]